MRISDFADSASGSSDSRSRDRTIRFWPLLTALTKPVLVNSHIVVLLNSRSVAEERNQLLL